jgi:hypothetical protein
MPLFTIETTYRLPVYRHRTYAADSVEEACRIAIADDDWWDQKHDYDNSGPTCVSGAWEGPAAAYQGDPLPYMDHAIPDGDEHPDSLASSRQKARAKRNRQPREKGRAKAPQPCR